MTERQKKRLDLAERVCRLVMRSKSCGLVEGVGYLPDVTTALHFMQTRGENEGGLQPGSLHWLGELGDAIKAAVFAWMVSVGIDPASHDKAETKLMAMEMAVRSLGVEYEGEVEQTPDAKHRWVERTADERAAAAAQEYCSGRIRGMEELRIAIAAEILEAEHCAREPFVKYAEALFTAMESARNDKEPSFDGVEEATVGLLQVGWRWMNLPRPDTTEDCPEVRP